MGWGWVGTISGMNTEVIRKSETEEALRLRIASMASTQVIGWPLRTWRENPSAFGNYRPAYPILIEARDSAV